MDWARRPYTTTARLHASEAAPLVTIRWYFTDLPFQTHESIINSRDFDEAPWVPRLLGEQPGYERRFDKHASPAGLDGLHQCGQLSDFTNGQPWPYTGPPVVYGEDDIPRCCRDPMPCKTQLCGQEQINGAPASQFYQFAVDATEADGTTPAIAQFVGDNLGNTSPASAGQMVAWLPQGRDGPTGWSAVNLADAAGVPVSRVEQFVIDADNGATRTIDAAGLAESVESGGVTTSLTLGLVGGVGKLSGSNLAIDPSIMPPFAAPLTAGSVTAAGNNQGNAAALGSDHNLVNSTNSVRGVILPPTSPVKVIAFANVFNCSGFNVYPANGDSINALAVDAPFVITNATNALHTNLWLAVSFGFSGAGGGWLLYRAAVIV